MNKGNNIELRSDEVRDILQKMPHWTIRWGITIIFVAVALLLVFTWLYRYPDLIRSEVVVSASNPPAVIKARSTGQITSLLVEDGQNIEKDQLLAVIENPAQLSHIISVQEYLIRIDPFIETLSDVDFVAAPKKLILGNVQSSFSDFMKLISDYDYFIKQKYFAERIVAIDGQIEMQKQMLNRLDHQKLLEEQRCNLASNSFRRDSSLLQLSAISQEEFENSKSQWLNGSLAFESVKKEWVQTQSDIFELKEIKAGLQLAYENELKNYRTNILNQYEQVKNEIQNWYLSYVLTSPIAGTASFNKVWAVNQNITAGETVVTVVPWNPVGILGKAYVPVRGAGKVKPGQRVNIKLSNYPYMEYGMLIGTVKRKAPVPVNNFYAIEIELPDKLTTNYGNTLEMQQELWGNCEIITEDLRLIQRIIYPVKALLERNKR